MHLCDDPIEAIEVGLAEDVRRQHERRARRVSLEQAALELRPEAVPALESAAAWCACARTVHQLPRAALVAEDVVGLGRIEVGPDRVQLQRGGRRLVTAVRRPQPRRDALQRRLGLERGRVGHQHQLHALAGTLDRQLQVAERAAARGLVVRSELVVVAERAQHRLDGRVDRRMVRLVAAGVSTTRHHLVRAGPEHADDGFTGSTAAHCDARRRARARRCLVVALQLQASLSEECLGLGEQRRTLLQRGHGAACMWPYSCRAADQQPVKAARDQEHGLADHRGPSREIQLRAFLSEGD